MEKQFNDYFDLKLEDINLHTYPFPHAVIDNFLPLDVFNKLHEFLLPQPSESMEGKEQLYWNYNPSVKTNKGNEIKENRSYRGFVYERLWDICIKFGLTHLTLKPVNKKLCTYHLIKGNPNKGFVLLSLKLLSINLAVLIADSNEFCTTAFNDLLTDLI